MTDTTSADWHRGDWMQTYTGRAFYPLAPRAEDVNELDIAHSLSMQCRYNGHVQRFYSVAEHCILMADYILDESGVLGDETAREHALWALLHDAAEAYIGDMVRPLKLHMPTFCEADDNVTGVIADRFGLVSRTIPPEVKAIDTRILLDERAALLGTPPGNWAMEGMEPLGITIRGWQPEQAKREYLIRLAELRPA
jgi:hypothetical protein